MSTVDRINEWVLENGYENVLIAAGMDDAFIGVTHNGIAVYDIEKCIEGLMKRNEWSDEEACEWMDYNVVGAYVGPKTPLYIYRFPEKGDNIDI